MFCIYSRKRVAASEESAATSGTKKSKLDSEDEKKLKVKLLVISKILFSRAFFVGAK